MCALAGVFSTKLSEETKKLIVNFLLNAQKHRGPDHSSLITYRNVVLGHNRLSIIDPSEEANQPFTTPSGNILIFNGEILNYREIRHKYGFKCHTRSDTEVLGIMLENLNFDLLNEVEGFFSFAYLDKRENALYLGRDFPGIKPLYFLIEGNELAFSSEEAPLLALKNYDEPAFYTIFLYLKLGYVPEPYTIDKKIISVPPGCIIKFTLEDSLKYEIIEFSKFLNKDLYHAGEDMTGKLSPASFLEEFRETIKRWVVADVPVASFLSSGVDSSLVSYYSSRACDTVAITLSFPEEKAIDEGPRARLFTTTMNINHRIITCTEDEMLKTINLFFKAINDLGGDPAMFNVFFLTHLIKNSFRVALTGEGGDELFAGYTKHKAWLYSTRLRKLPLIGFLPYAIFKNSYKLTKVISVIKTHGIDSYLELSSFVPDWIIGKYTYIEPFCSRSESLPLLSEIIRNDAIKDLSDVLIADILMVLPSNMLLKADRGGMYNSVEVRPPFLSPRIIELALKIPVNLKIRNGIQKFFLKEAVKDIFPEFVVSAPKRGFEVPLRKWLSGPLRELIEVASSIPWIKQQKIIELKKRISPASPLYLFYFLWFLIVYFFFTEKVEKLRKELKEVLHSTKNRTELN